MLRSWLPRPNEQRFFFQLKGHMQKWNLLTFRESKCVKLLVLRKLAKALRATFQFVSRESYIIYSAGKYRYRQV